MNWRGRKPQPRLRGSPRVRTAADTGPVEGHGEQRHGRALADRPCEESRQPPPDGRRALVERRWWPGGCALRQHRCCRSRVPDLDAGKGRGQGRLAARPQEAPPGPAGEEFVLHEHIQTHDLCASSVSVGVGKKAVTRAEQVPHLHPRLGQPHALTTSTPGRPAPCPPLRSRRQRARPRSTRS